MDFPRSAGLLLHPTSLPGSGGVGTLGKEARGFVDFIARAELGLWQILPLGPTGYGDSPYQSLSAFAGNPYLIDLEELAALGLVDSGELAAASAPNTGRVDFGGLFTEKNRLIDAAWAKFKAAGANSIDAKTVAAETRAGGAGGTSSGAGGGMAAEFEAFSRANAYWLDDFALFLAIKESHNFHSWDRWPADLKKRKAEALAEFSRAKRDRILRHKFAQYLFRKQWDALRAYANSRRVKIIGDIPIFVAYDSADTWAHPELFLLRGDMLPSKVAGVPPDYFAATGQLWGNPLYDWEQNSREAYAWWIARIKSSFDLVDILRIDHFRGFVGYWAVPADHKTAAGGSWEKGPGIALFEAIRAALGELPIIAEDLGFITPEIRALRDRLGFPGMKILQFAFEAEDDNPDYPHNYPRNSVVYTGTHDNDTCMGWLKGAAPAAARRALGYVGGRRAGFAWNMIKAAWASPASMAIAPMQDLLSLGTETRMNYPGKQDHFWSWRMADGALDAALCRRLRALTRRYFRGAR